jgi:hypothetical protein
LSGQQTSLVKQFSGNYFLKYKFFSANRSLPSYGNTRTRANQSIDAGLIFPHDVKYAFEQLQQTTGYEQMLLKIFPILPKIS